MKARRVIFSLLCLVLTFVLGGEVILSAFFVKASAAEAFDIKSSDTLSDLEGAVIDGVPFNVNDYNPAINNMISFLTLYEYGYARSDINEDVYSLYVYAYFPFETAASSSVKSTITLRTGGNTNGFYYSYDLDFVGESKDPSHGGIFRKYLVCMTEDQKADIRSTLSHEKRVYEVGEANFRLANSSDSHLVEVGGKYEYTGYMVGCDPTSLSDSTLALVTSKGAVVTLDVRSTYYRMSDMNNPPLTENETDISAYDTLHSVYFSVPKAMTNAYGDITAVHARWFDAVTKPALVIGSEEIYNAVLPCVDNSMILPNYSFKSDWSEGGLFDGKEYMGYVFNYTSLSEDSVFNTNVGTLRLLFRTTQFGTDAADKHIVTAEGISSYIDYRTSLHCQDPVYQEDCENINGKYYSRLLFSYLSDTPREMNILSTDKLLIGGAMVDQTWWESLWGELHISSFDKYSIKAIQKVTVEDLTLDALTDANESREFIIDTVTLAAYRALREEYPEMSDYEFVRDYASDLLPGYLWIDKADVESFLAYFEEKTAKGEDVYLLRYQVSDYLAEEAAIFEYDAAEDEWAPHETDFSNAYFFQMTVNLGFDVIDLTLTKDGCSTVIPVVMEAQNIFHDATPPPVTSSDEDNISDLWDVLQMIFGIVGLIVLLLMLSFAMPFIRPILDVLGELFKGLFAILLFPFKALGSWITRKRK